MVAQSNEAQLRHNVGGVRGNDAEDDLARIEAEAGQGDDLVDAAPENDENGDVQPLEQPLLSEHMLVEDPHVRIDPMTLGFRLNAFAHFRNSLYEHRIQYLFPQVSFHLIRYFENLPIETTAATNGGESSNRNGHANQQAGTSSVSEILRLRTVYKSWNNWMETMHENLSLFSKMNSTEMIGFENAVSIKGNERFPSANQFCQRTRGDHFAEDDQEKITKFIKHFEETHNVSKKASKNPFLGRNVTFNYFETGFPPVLTIGGSTHLTGIRGILSKYGEHISVCVLHARDTNLSRWNYYSQLVELLLFLRKLKFLEICYSRYSTEYKYDPKHGFVSRQVDVQPSANDLKEFEYIANNNITNNICQEARQLLKGFSAKSLPTSIFNSFLRAYNTISRLEIENIDDHDIDVIKMPNLTQLVIQISKLRDWEKVKKGAWTDWPLETLHSEFSKEVWPLLGWSGLMTVLHSKWIYTLTNLIIKLPLENHSAIRKYCGLQSRLSSLCFPHLQYLGLVLNDTFNLDFLLPINTNLKKLNITIRCCYFVFRCRRKKLLKFQGDSIKFLEFFELGLSNEEYSLRERLFWNKFPKLESFDFWVEEHNHGKPMKVRPSLTTYHYGAEKINKWSEDLFNAVNTGGKY